VVGCVCFLAFFFVCVCGFFFFFLSKRLNNYKHLGR
jgi:hypothetical protein